MHFSCPVLVTLRHLFGFLKCHVNVATVCRSSPMSGKANGVWRKHWCNSIVQVACICCRSGSNKKKQCCFAVIFPATTNQCWTWHTQQRARELSVLSTHALLRSGLPDISSTQTVRVLETMATTEGQFLHAWETGCSAMNRCSNRPQNA